VEVGAGLEPSASLGSWCTLGQTHETAHVDGADKWAKLCIYLKESPADCHLNFSLVETMMEAPSDESILMEKIALAVPYEAGVVAH
jgi:hypothetical protein